MKKAYLLFLPVALFAGTLAHAQSAGIKTVAGLYNDPGFAGDGNAATNAKFDTMGYVAVDKSDNIYIADAQNNRIRKVDYQTGIITTYAGTGTPGWTGDYGAADSAEIYYPLGLAVDTAYNLYFTDNGNGIVREIIHSTGKIYTIAGTGNSGNTGDDSAATDATFWDPTGITVDLAGNVYIADDVNNNIREVTVSDGIIHLYAGNGVRGYSGDGAAAIAAELNSPEGISVDKSGNLYIADLQNNVVREVNASGTISTVSGIQGNNSVILTNGQANTIPLSAPTDVSCDKYGNVFIADVGASVIRELNMTSNVGYEAIAAGNGVSGYSGDGGLAIDAEINYPLGICVDTNSNIIVGDLLNFVIRSVGSYATAVPEIAATGNLTIFPNPANNNLNIVFPTTYISGKNNIEIVDVTGRTISSTDVETKAASILSVDVSNLATGMYFVKIADATNSSSQVFKFIKE